MNELLFPDLPKNKTRLQQWKEKYEVQTNGDGDEGEGKWIATSIPWARKGLGEYLKDGDEYTDLFNLMAGFCRLLDEWDLLGEGATEEDACLSLARKMKVNLTL